jgi:transcription initiation factor TFIIF subunit alpha
MAPAATESLLFHPKKNKKQPTLFTPKPRPKPVGSPSTPNPTPNAASPSSPSKTQAKKPEPILPDAPYQEYKILSTPVNEWVYDVVRFDNNRKQVDIATWQVPIKYNRKDLRRPETTTEPEAPQAVRPMLGLDGKPVIQDGRIVMVDAQGRPIQNTEAPPKEKDPKKNGKKKFQKKTKQVHLIPDDVRQLRREERYPWVMEDASGKEVWVGRMEEANKADLRAFFMAGTNNTFQFVPAHRWYRFTKPKLGPLPTTEEIESTVSL